METTIDGVGRIVLPKVLRDALGLRSGSTVDISLYGAGLQLVPTGRTARIREVDGRFVADSSIVVTDGMVFDLIDAGRK